MAMRSLFGPCLICCGLLPCPHLRPVGANPDSCRSASEDAIAYASGRAYRIRHVDIEATRLRFVVCIDLGARSPVPGCTFALRSFWCEAARIPGSLASLGARERASPGLRAWDGDRPAAGAISNRASSSDIQIPWC
ncbi:hypothetical protein L226DRAFT_69055 [Lentinus tigrinus ALCF2SS1-7]|uniref:uncharacterized protein n=1 Tax=Lentinus tigrinus ALCF2SS1-7 TaxID=1328758 RepID=UPI001166262D|nr:hypothetical protein L226DRAFT_69055 [Lentinus tigrinus ALCF2SS1-7]